jgi:hypothetical protein
MADDGWIDVAQKPADDGWVNVGSQQQPPAEQPSSFNPIDEGYWSSAGRDMVNTTSTGGIMAAFGQGFREASGPEPLGLSPESVKALSKLGIFAPEGQKEFQNPFQAFNEGIILPAAAVLDGAIRTFNGTYRGLQAAGIAAGLPNDIVSLPDAFAGSPGALGEIRVRPGLPEATMRVIEEGPPPGMKPSNGLKLTEAPEGGVYTPDQFKPGERYFKALDADGNVAAEMLVKIEGKTARIEDILNPNAPREEGIGTVGTSDMLGLLKQFREKNPEVTEITGNRVSGAREGGGYDLEAKNEIAITLPAAKDLGVIGPDRLPISEGTPAEAAQRTVAANAKPGEKVTQEVGGEPNPWRERFDQFVGKIKTGDDVKQLITDAADQNGEFQAARAGEIPLKQFGDITEAAGVDPGTVDRSGVGRLLRNDNMVRNAMQGMLSATEQVKAAARDVKADPSEANLMKLQEAMLRRDTWVEQVVGHRAEWGRTGNVFQEFLVRSKEEGGFTQFLKDQDRSPEGLKKLADAIDNLDPAQAAKLLSDANKPTFWDKFKWYWVNALISGPVTHAKYIVANAAFGAYEAAITTPVAGAIGAVRRGVFGGNEGVFVGEAAAKTWGLIAGVPDALKAAVEAGRTGLQTPLPGELAQGIVPKRNQNVAYQQRPIPGALGAVIGVPSKGASAIHSFFNFLGYRASIEAQAYRAAAKEGLSPLNDAFWQRREGMAARPTEEMMNAAIEDGYRLTYISELGDTGRKLSAFVNSTKAGQLIMPFTHIPLNILKRAVEGTPAAWLDKETREAMAGKHGAAKQDMAIARMVTGAAVGGWAVNQVLNERMTGFGPTDPKERAEWMAAGHQPYSIRIGDEWLSFNRFGSLGTMLGLYANLAEVIPHMKPDSEELTKAIGMTVHSTGRLMEDEVGMQGLSNLMQAIDQPDRSGSRYVANFTGSLLPYSSLLRQVASSMDPSMREAKTVVDGLRYYIPVARQGLLPKRDWSGTPIANAGYGGDLPVPGLSSIIQHRSAVADPVALEFQALDIKPAPPQDRIKGVKLPPQLYDIYQSTAGPFTRTALEHYVNTPGWHDLPIGVRADIFRSTIRATREAAGAAMQMRYPQLIQQGVEDRVNRINGGKPGKLQDVSAP